jgi:hypothetical protein
VEVIVIDQPPVNAAVSAMVIHGAGRRQYWTPAPLLEELGRSGGSFQALRAGARREESGS